MESNMLNAQQVATLVGVSTPTLNMWYKWKNENPDNEYAKLLPDYVQDGKRGIGGTRYWESSSIDAIINFKNVCPKGRNGVRGSVTQRYVKKTK